MKRHVLNAILTLASASVFAIDATTQSFAPATVIPQEQQIKLSERVSPSKGFFYVKMNIAEPQAHTPQLKQTSFLPGIGFGYRRGAASAIDISFGGSHIRDEGEEATCWSLPKMSYLRYFSPKKSSSFYAGAGLTWGGMSLKNKNEPLKETLFEDEATGESIVTYSHSRTFFFGLIPSVCMGYESNRKEASWRSFVQLEVSQPMLAVDKRGEFPGPVAEFSVGLGY